MTAAHSTHSERATRRILFAILGVSLVVALVFGGFYVGFQRGVTAGTNVTVTGVITGDSEVENADFNLFWEAWQKLRDNHIDSDKVTNQELVYGAIRGLAGSFDDPHTSFFPPEEARKFEEDVAGSFGGVGAEIGLNDDEILSVVAPLEGGPAQRQGILSGDLILKIDGESTSEMSVDEAVSQIRGPVGSTVALEMYRTGWPRPREVSIVRDLIEVPTLDIDFLQDGAIAHLQLYSFNENAMAELGNAVERIHLEKAQGIILDVRNNPGGYLEVAIGAAGFFIERGEVIVSEEFKDGTREPFIAGGNALLKDLPVVVLINGGSASASEILAGALRDIRGAKLVGERSYGKGTVQEIQRLSDTSTMKVTIARWVMPAGGVLDEVGLEPDYVVEITEADLEADRDSQLEKALEVLKAQVK